ncbi:MAG TPA: hypothetical protein VFZ61_12195 [Polyangiales bacterium]
MAYTARDRRARRSALLCVAAGLGLGLTCALFAWPFLVDDAFIVARFAERLARGAGYGFQAGPRADGVTGPLWLLPLVLAALSGLPTVFAAKLFGLAASAGAAALVLRAAWSGQGGRAQAGWLALLLGTAGPVWLWAIGGLETGLATCLCAWLALSALARPAPRGEAAGVAAAALAWLRPELAFWVAFQCGLVLWRDRRAGAKAFGVAIAGALALLAFRWLQFGHLLPLSAHAKPPVLSHGIRYVFECARATGALVLVPWILLALARGQSRVRALAVGLLIHACAVALAGGDWMPGARLFAPLAPLACAIAADQIAGASRRWPRAVVALALITLAVRAESSWRESVAARSAGATRERRLPELLAAIAPYAGPVAALDIGALGYFTDRTLIDLGGLVEPAVAYAPGGHVAKRIDAGWLMARAPTVIVLHSRLMPRVDAQRRLRWFAGFPVERSVLAQPWVLTRFRVAQVVPYTTDYFYVILTRD